MNAPSHIRPLAIAVCAVLSIAIAAPVFAQDVGTSMRAQREKRLKELGKGKEDKKQEEAQLYPEATRQSPEATAKGEKIGRAHV